MAVLALRRCETSDRPALARMLELYQYELSDIWDQDLDANGEFGYDLESFWRSPTCHAFIATVSGRYAGFATVDRRVKVGPEGWWMDQFFVLKKYRRAGVGAALAAHVFQTLPGDWEVGQMPANWPARAFWRRVITVRSHGHFSEHRLEQGRWTGIVQRFHCV